MIIKREHVRIEPADSPAARATSVRPVPAAGPQPSARPRASLRPIELGGELRGFELVCACGETHAVELVLDEPADAAPAARGAA